MLRPLALDLEERRAAARLGGGEEKIARQHDAGKLTARERIALLIDDGTFTELGIHARPHFSQRAMDGREAPADGVDHRLGRASTGAASPSPPTTSRSWPGSMGMTGEIKVARLRELALTKRIPIVWLLDSAGARIQEAVGSLFAGTGHLFREEVVMSGVVPQVAALMGPCAAGTAYIPGLADFVPMVSGRGSMALAGPAPGARGDRRGRHAGGARRRARALPQVGRRRSRGAPTTRSASSASRQYLSYFPSQLRGRAAGPAGERSRGPDGGRAARRPAGLQPQAVRHVRRDQADRRRRVVVRPQAEVGAHDHHLLRADGRAAGRDRGVPAAPPRRHPRQRLRRQGRAVRDAVRRVRHPARLPRRRARVHGRHEGRGGRHHPPRRQDAARGRRPPRCPRSRSCCARPTAPATTS